MSKQRIAILGPIGSFKIGQTQYTGVSLKDVTVMVAKLPSDTSELWIDVAGPGGHKETGDMIYNYLDSLKSRMKVHTNQVGDIGSIDTKIFLVGEQRVALEGINPETMQPYDFFVHNPWNTGVTGDADTLALALEQARAEEEDLISFYVNRVAIDREAIQPLMKLQTGFDAKEALAMKFATSTRLALNTAAYMEKEKSLGERLDSLIAMTEKLLSGKKPALAMVLELDNGTKISANTDDAAKLEKAMVVTVDAAGVPTSTPVADGSYKLKDGSKSLVVKGGMVEKVESVAAPAAPTADAVMAAKIEKLEKFIADQSKSEEEKKMGELIDAKIKLGIEEFKATLKSTHRPVHKEVIIDYKTVRETPVQARNRENAERSVKK
jgi:ATP-dependent protease ClpP protease subunit